MHVFCFVVLFFLCFVFSSLYLVWDFFYIYIFLVVVLLDLELEISVLTSDVL